MTTLSPPEQASASARWVACSLPALGALACLLYALAPERFPVDAGRWIAFAAVGEIPALFLGVVHALALKEGRRGERYFVFGIGLLVLLLGGGLHLAWQLAASDLAPVFGWIVLGMLVELHANPGDPQLAHDRAWALLNDRASLLGYVPNLLVAAVLLMLLAHLGLLLGGGGGLDVFLSARLQALEASDLALLPALYLAVVSVCTAHVHSARFLHDRRGLLAVLEARWLPAWWPLGRR